MVPGARRDIPTSLYLVLLGNIIIIKKKRVFFCLYFILRRMGKNKAQAHHTSTYFHTRRVSMNVSLFVLYLRIYDIQYVTAPLECILIFIVYKASAPRAADAARYARRKARKNASKNIYQVLRVYVNGAERRGP